MSEAGFSLNPSTDEERSNGPCRLIGWISTCYAAGDVTLRTDNANSTRGELGLRKYFQFLLGY